MIKEPQSLDMTDQSAPSTRYKVLFSDWMTFIFFELYKNIKRPFALFSLLRRNRVI